jgi:hypothetical protein
VPIIEGKSKLNINDIRQTIAAIALIAVVLNAFLWLGSLMVGANIPELFLTMIISFVVCFIAEPTSDDDDFPQSPEAP